MSKWRIVRTTDKAEAGFVYCERRLAKDLTKDADMAEFKLKMYLDQVRRRNRERRRCRVRLKKVAARCVFLPRYDFERIGQVTKDYLAKAPQQEFQWIAQLDSFLRKHGLERAP